MRPTSRSSILDSGMLAAGQNATVSLLPEIVRRSDELPPRFAAYYIQLSALPRRVRKALQRQWHMPLAGVALMLALGQSPALAATIPVNASCTLVNAITAANTDSATGGCPAGSGADTIVLPPGSTQTLTTVNNSTHGPTGLPVVRSVVTIQGQGGTIRRDSAAPEFRILAVNSTGDLTLRDTITSGGSVSYSATYPNNSGGGVANFNGTLIITNSTIEGNYASGGGGVRNSGSATIIDSTISGNSAFDVGGGVDNFGGTVTVTNSTISGNSAINCGGGVHNSGIATMIDSTISRNSASYGGGICNYGYNPGTVTVLNSTISGNIASGSYGGGEGGGVVTHGTLIVLNSTISGNTAKDSVFFGGRGGGLMSGFDSTVMIMNSTITGNYAAYGTGGGVDTLYSDVSTITVLNSTISGNVASEGGGIKARSNITVLNSTISGNTAFLGGGLSGGITVLNSTISGNSAEGRGGGVENRGTLTLARTLISGNTAPTGSEIYNDALYGYGTVVANNHNLFGVNGNAGVVGFTPGLTDVVPPAGVQLGNILNSVLAFNGGPTETHALVPGSPAIDAGGAVCTDANGNPLLTDQRGKPRIIDGNRDGTSRCDIGAFEFFPVVNNLVTLDPGLDISFDPTPVPGAPAGTFTIGATFTNTSGTPLRFPFFTVTELSGGNVLLNAEEGPRGVDATITPNVGDQVLSPGETVDVDFVIGLQTPAPFTFFVDLFGEPLGLKNTSKLGQQKARPSGSTKKP